MYRLEWKESVWSQGGVGRQEMRFVLPLFSTHIMKAHSEKCVGTAVIRISFTWFAWKCVLFTLSWWLYLGLTNSWCRLSADGDSFVGFMLTRQCATNNSAFSAASPICGGWVGGCHGWSRSSGSWSHVNVRLVAFYCLSLFAYKPGWLQTFLPSDRRAIKSDPSQLPTLPPRKKKKWFDLASNVAVFLKTSLSRCSPSA